MRDNIDYINIVLFGYVVYSLAGYFESKFDIFFPKILIVFSYYFCIGLLLRKKPFVLFISLSFIFLSIYFSVISTGNLDIDGVIIGLSSERFAINAYMLILLPFLFLGFTINFFKFSKSLTQIRTGRKLILWIIPVLIKKEMINERYILLMDAFEARGINTKNFITRFILMPKWIKPLLITTIIEGVETYDYNKMLRSDIYSYVYPNDIKIKFYKKLFSLLLIVFVILILIENGFL